MINNKVKYIKYIGRLTISFEHRHTKRLNAVSVLLKWPVIIFVGYLQEWRRKPRSAFSRKMLLFNTASRDTLWFTNFTIGPSTTGE